MRVRLFGPVVMTQSPELWDLWETLFSKGWEPARQIPQLKTLLSPAHLWGASLPTDSAEDPQKKLDDTRTRPRALDRRGAAREGAGLLQGLALCGRCGHRMGMRYNGPQRRPVYMCLPNVGPGVCWSVSAPAIDCAVSQLFLEAVQPPQIELSLAVVHEAERQAGEVDRQWKLRLERARYEAQLAERRYKAIDPDHRVVARTLEREWNDKLVELERLEREYQDVRRREQVDLTAADRLASCPWPRTSPWCGTLRPPRTPSARTSCAWWCAR
jgi:Recombinase zinc beta ribbon domain